MTYNKIFLTTLALLVIVFPEALLAAEQGTQTLNLTDHWVGWLSIGLFVLAYIFVMAEEFTHL